MEQLNKFYVAVVSDKAESELITSSEKELRVYGSLEDALNNEYIMNTFNYNAVLFARESLMGNVITAKELINGTGNIEGIAKSKGKIYIYEVTLNEDILLVGSTDESLLALPIYNEELCIKYSIKDESIAEKLGEKYFSVCFEDTMHSLTNLKYALVKADYISSCKLVAESYESLEAYQSNDYMCIYNEALSQEMRFVLDGVKVI